MAAQFATYAPVGAFLANRASIPLSLLPAALVVFGIGGIVGNAVAARLADRIGADRTILVSLGALGAVFAALVVMPPIPWLGFTLLAAWAVFGMLFKAPQQKRLVTLAGSRRNLVLALHASAIYLGMSVGSVAAGMANALLGAAVLPLLSLLLALAGDAAWT